tara:strand:+ start:1048 stop:1275 length:228 start_codon:yes stop_codon:yes gene_type:complete
MTTEHNTPESTQFKIDFYFEKNSVKRRIRSGKASKSPSQKGFNLGSYLAYSTVVAFIEGEKNEESSVRCADISGA